MLKKLENDFKRILTKFLKENYSIDLKQVFLFEVPPDSKFGDLSCRIAFILSPILKKNPVEIANEIKEIFRENELVKKIELAGKGFINIFFDRKKYIEEYRKELLRQIKDKRINNYTDKIIIEHTNINPNKAAHIGHIRNACLGDTLGRMLKFLGYNTEIQNYIDDTGVQLADVVVGFLYFEKKNLEDIKSITEKFDYYCWDLYYKVNQWYEENEYNRQYQHQVLKAIEEGNNEIAEVAKYISETIVQCHLKTMKRLNIVYDLLTKESDIVNLRFWDEAFRQLKDRGAIQFKEDGKYKGCWIMPLSDHPELSNLSEPDKILIRSNGTLTYVAKDIAYQLWKFGLLDKDFYYKEFPSPYKDKILWQTCSFPYDKISHSFGKATKVYNVIDVRQSYLQKIVSESLKILGYEQQAKNSIHFAYEIVALSPKSIQDMNVNFTEASSKEFVSMSGRKGIGVKADDFIDAIEKKAYQEILQRNPDIPSEQAENIAKIITTAAIRYYMLKYSNNKIIIFDLEEALNFDGETGPYLQYAAVRANNIIKKLKEKGFYYPSIEESCSASEESFYAQDFEAIWQLIYIASRTSDIIEKAIENLELSLFAKHVYALAQKFNYFYYKYDVIHMPEEIRNLRSFIVNLFKHQYELALNMLGISVPEKM